MSACTIESARQYASSDGQPRGSDRFRSGLGGLTGEALAGRGRRFAHMQGEELGEVGRVGETELLGDVRDRGRRVDQAPLGFQDEAVLDNGERRQTRNNVMPGGFRIAALRGC